MTTPVHWLHQVTGSFTNASDWSTGAVPGSADDAILDAPGNTAYTVTSSVSETVASIQTASTAALAITGGVFDATGGTAAGKNAGEVTLSSSATLEVGGTFDNTGSISSAGTLSGTGTLELTGGTATFNAGSDLAIANVTQAAGSTALFETTVTAGDWTQTGGTLSVGSGDTATFSGGSSFAGTLTGAGTLGLGGTIALSGVTLSAGGLSVDGGMYTTTAAVTLSGTITDPGEVTMEGHFLVGSGGATLSGAGAVCLFGGYPGPSGGDTGPNGPSNAINGATSTAVLTLDTRLEGWGRLGETTSGSGGMELAIGPSGSIYSREYELAITTLGTINNQGYIVCAGDGPLGVSGMVIEAPIDNTGYLVAYSSTLFVYGVSGPGHIEVENSGTLQLGEGFNDNVTFTAGSTGTLELYDSKADTTGAITGFSKTGANSLDLLDIPFVSGTTTAVYTGTATSGVLTVSEGANVAKINLIGDYLGSTFTVSSSSAGGTQVVDPTTFSEPQLTPAAPLSPHPHAFIAAAAAFGAPGAGASALESVHRSTSPPMLAMPRSLAA
jgi:hypothetical protein